MAQLMTPEELPEAHPSPGIVRRVVAGQALMLAEFTISAGCKIPPHSHPHEQIGYVVAGRARFISGESVRDLGPGSVYAFPCGVLHEVQVLGDDDATFVDVFTPVREEYMP
jgi:quercetin dioxygenase-like cupin family protein